MNYCTKCHSIYSQPGTCNCYAPTAPPIYTPNTYPLPYWPPTISPTVIPFVPWAPTITWGTHTTSDCVRIEVRPGQSTSDAISEWAAKVGQAEAHNKFGAA